jgi:PHD/YefM family antitoxin component YafN of YafNO toxin-antitoxin module
LFARDGRPVAILISHDEYLALRETIEVSNNADLRRQIETAEDEVKRGAMMLPEDLFVE